MNGTQIPNVEVVATLLLQSDKLLSIFNPRWGAFTFPMSKRRFFMDTIVSETATPEKLNRAAARVAAEVLGRSFQPDEFPTPLLEIKNFEQSDVDGIWKLYTIHVFTLKLSEGVCFAPGLVAEWRTPKELDTREPVTRTARFILARMAEQRLLPPCAC